MVATDKTPGETKSIFDVSHDISITSVGDDNTSDPAQAFVNSQHPSLSMFTDIKDADKTEAIREYLKVNVTMDFIAKFNFIHFRLYHKSIIWLFLSLQF